MKKKIICFDLDNVLCNTNLNDYRKSKPIKKNINTLNKLYQNGFYIKIFTARYMGRNRDNITKAKKQAYKITLSQLKKWNVKYDKLIFGKPSFDYYVDDKSIFYDKNWAKKIERKLL